MPNASLLSLPYELVLHISQYLEFADVWYLGTCSHACKTLSFQLLQSLYQIDLIKPRIINPFGQSIHAAVAYLTRHGKTDSTDQQQQQQQQQHIIQSVANHLAIGIYDRMPSKSGRAFSLDFLLNRSLGILLEHCMFDSTLHAFMKSQETHVLSQQFDQIIASIRARQQDQQQQQQQSLLEQQQKYTGVLMVDFLATLHDTLVAILEEQDMVSQIYHHLLINHMQRLLRDIKSRYQHHHSDQSSYSQHQAPPKNTPQPSQDFKLFIKLICCLLQTNLLSSIDMDSMTYYYINHFFLTQPSDVSFSRDAGLKIYIRQQNAHLSIVNTVTLDKRPAYHYQWRLWLEETQVRLGVLLDILRAMIQKNCCSSSSSSSSSQGDGAAAAPDFVHITAMLQDTVSALTLSEAIHQNDDAYEIPLVAE